MRRVTDTKRRATQFVWIYVLLLFAATAQAQQIQIQGLVLDENAEPLIGATVSTPDRKVGTTTDLDGLFQLSGLSVGDSLIVSYIGYKTYATVLKANEKFLRVDLDPDTELLSEIVVVGYGEQKKASVVGAIAQVSTKELSQSPVSNVSTALAGRLPGMITVQRSGEPGADQATMYIRGISTFGSSQTPLVLVDGVERDIRMLDVSEIETISILKDASATAVYGVRGANGVVLVTTKRGVSGKATVTFTADVGWQSPTSMPELVDSYNMAILTNEALVNDGLNPSFTQEEINAFRTGSNPFLYPNNDWQDICLKDAAMMQQYNVNVTGGSEKVKYFVGANVLLQDGLFKYADYNDNYSTNVKYTKYNFRSNIDFNLSEMFSAKLNLAGIIGEKHRPAPGGDVNFIFDRIKIANPDGAPIRNPDGSWSTQEKANLNPLAYILDTGYADETESAIQATVGVTADFSRYVKGLSVNVDFSFDFNNMYIKNYSKSSDMFRFDTDGSYHRLFTTSALNFGDNLSAYNQQWVFEPSIRYNNTFGDHAVTGLVLFNAQEITRKGDALGRLPYRRLGLVGRATYAYKDKYLAEVNVGYNGSENFAPGHRFGLFPAFSVGWVISEEDFFNSSFIDYLKFRASYGIVGNDQIGGDRFLYLSLWQNADGTMLGYPSSSNVGGTNEKRTGNESLTWEKAKKFNFGFDTRLFNNHLELTVDAFYEKRSNILTNIDIVPGTYGGPSIQANAGVVENRGLEFDATWHGQIGKDFTYFFGGNYSFARNKILERPESPQAYDYLYTVGRAVGQPFGYVALGLFQSEEEILESPSQFGVPLYPGDIKYMDINGDGQVDSNDRYPIGFSNVPEMFYSFKLGFTYKRFDFSVLFQGAGNVTYNFQTSTNIPFNNERSTPIVEWLDRWTPENRDASLPRISYTRPGNNNYQTSTFWQKNGNYLRLKNMEIGYTLPDSWVHAASIEDARIYVNGMNLLTWDKLPVYDPENTGGNYPLMRVINFGVKVTF